MKKMKKNLISLSVVFNLILLNCAASQSNESFTRTNFESDVVENYDNLTRIEEILELFSVSIIGKQWKEIHGKIHNQRCAHDMTKYLEGLAKKKIWAIKSKSMISC
jgi:hypothetical protein